MTDLDLKIAERVLFLRVNNIRVSPSHSTKLIFGMGFIGSILTTLESTCKGTNLTTRLQIQRLKSNCT